MNSSDNSNNNSIDDINNLSPTMVNIEKLPPENMRVNGFANGQGEIEIKNNIKWLTDQLTKVIDVNIDLRKRIHVLEDYTEELNEWIIDNMNDIVDLQSYSRRENIEIRGIPDNIKQNDLELYVVKILNKIGVGVNSYGIAACHRLKSRKNQYQNVIVRFINRKHAIKSIENSYKLQISNFSNDRKKFIYENLCPYFKKLFNKCYALAAKNIINKVYTKQGKVYIVTNVNEQIVKINSFEQLDEILNI